MTNRFNLSYILLLWVSVNVCVVHADAFLNYTIDCQSFSPKASGNTCELYGNQSAWDRITTRPLPDWYADMKLGIFIHWGVFSVPSYGTEWFWHNYACGNSAVKSFADRAFPQIKQDYPQYADLWKAELYDAEAWVEAFKLAGAQYVLPVAKHHDGFCLWDAEATSPDWNAVQVGPKRDVLTELYNASLAANLSFGIYYSQGEWFDADFVADARSGFKTNQFVERKLNAQRLDLVHRYPEAMLWHTDGGWMAPDAYWNNLDWLNYVYDASPLAAHVVSCNSMGVGCCAHFGTGKQRDKCWEYGDAPSGGDRTTAGAVAGHFYTNQMTLQRGSWSWDRSEDDLTHFFSAKELIWTLVSTTAWNGTLIMNIGPTADGLIPPIFLDRLSAVGDWLRVNGEAIYGTRPWSGSLPSGVEGATSADFAGSANATYYTAGGPNSCRQGQGSCVSSATGAVYAVLMRYASQVYLKLPIPTSSTRAELLVSSGSVNLKWHSHADGGMLVELPAFPQDSANAWVIKLTHLQNGKA